MSNSSLSFRPINNVFRPTITPVNLLGALVSGQRPYSALNND